MRRLILMVSLIFCLIFFFCIFAFRSNAKQTVETETYYTSIVVQPGDSLWSIASTYTADTYVSNSDYIREVKSINHIIGDEIHAGAYLTIPYYVVVEE